MKRPFFRVGDPVTVSYCPITGVLKKHKGRVICVNRKNKYDLCVVVLYEILPGSEMIETFTQEGKRVLASDPCSIELGWNSE
jgi:hypothetical protein